MEIKNNASEIGIRVAKGVKCIIYTILQGLAQPQMLAEPKKPNPI